MANHETQPQNPSRRAFFRAVANVGKFGSVARLAQVAEEALPTVSAMAAGANLLLDARQTRVANAAGCAERVSSIELCPPEGQTPRAGIIVKARSFDNLNGKPGFQPGQDRDAEWMTGWRYTVVNTADRTQVAEAIVDQDGDLVDLATGSNLFVFDGQPNTVETVHGKPAIIIEFRRRDAFDRTLNKIVEKGDAVLLASAVNCTPLQATLRTNKEFLVQPAPTPTPTPEVPVEAPKPTPTPIVPKVQIPTGVPRTGGTEPAQIPLDELPEAERRLIIEHPAVPRQ